MESGRRWAMCTVAIVLICSGCGGAESNISSSPDSSAEPKAPYVYSTPVASADGWQTEHAELAGLDVVQLESMTTAARDNQYGRIDSIVVVKSGKLVHEAYFGDWTAYALHETRSVSKSVISLLTGIAIDKGLLAGIDAPLLDYFPEYSPYGNWDDRKNDIQIRHLLTMSSGLDCDDTDATSTGQEGLMFSSSDWVKFFVDLKMLSDPGAKFRYCAGSVIALSGILEKVSGVSGAEFARSALFEPLGISNIAWTTDPKGRLHPNGLSISARDLAKIGKVMMDGEWGGAGIVSDKWREDAVSHQIVDQTGDSAGFLWWRVTLEIDGESAPSFLAYGAGGQLMLVVPSRQIVLVIMGSNFNTIAFSQVFALVANQFIPAL